MIESLSILSLGGSSGVLLGYVGPAGLGAVGLLLIVVAVLFIGAFGLVLHPIRVFRRRRRLARVGASATPAPDHPAARGKLRGVG
jgi:hypothetical protein